jgi:hypothetical protein
MPGQQVLRLFVSSPGDVTEERRRVELVVARLNAEFHRRASIKVVRWEDKVAEVMWLQGDRDQALSNLRAALAIWDDLANVQPANVYWQAMHVVERSKIDAVTAADLGGQGAQPALLPDYILATSSERRLGDQDLAGLGREQLWLARNEIFARHGRYFTEPALVGYFSRFSWYRPYTWLTDLTTDETANVNFLLRAEQQAKARAGLPMTSQHSRVRRNNQRCS